MSPQIGVSQHLFHKNQELVMIEVEDKFESVVHIFRVRSDFDLVLNPPGSCKGCVRNAV